MRTPSPSTQLRNALRELKDTKGALSLCKMHRDQYQARAAALTQEVKEWKERFDALLKKMGQDPL